MIQGSEDAVLWLQLSEPLTVGMLGDLGGRGRVRTRSGKEVVMKAEKRWRKRRPKEWEEKRRTFKISD